MAEQLWDPVWCLLTELNGELPYDFFRHIYTNFTSIFIPQRTSSQALDTLYLHENTTAALLTVVESNQDEIYSWINE